MDTITNNANNSDNSNDEIVKLPDPYLSADENRAVINYIRSYQCPILIDFLKDPVEVNGIVYSREGIESHLEHSQICPITRQELGANPEIIPRPDLVATTAKVQSLVAQHTTEAHECLLMSVNIQRLQRGQKIAQSPTERKRRRKQEEFEGISDVSSSASEISKIPLALQQRIVEKVRHNRLTIIVGATGSGKSTLVPQILLDNYGGPIVCTQPRRLAVVAVSKYVAEQRSNNSTARNFGGAPIQQEVGYHVGGEKSVTKDTTLLFATAGILLEQLRAQGIKALEKYKVVIMDECHERSPESDLCIAIIKSLLKRYPQTTVRIALMSATFNHVRYCEYFSTVPGCNSIDMITIQSAQNVTSFYERVKTYYCEEVLAMLPLVVRGNFKDWEQSMKTNINAVEDDDETNGNGKSLPSTLLSLIFALVVQLDKQEPTDAIFLVFAPTYLHLEQIYDILSMLKGHIGGLVLDVLHSSIDIESCLQSMNLSSSSEIDTEDDNNCMIVNGEIIMPSPAKKIRRRILIASAIADSSVTIPGVTCVIDTCRSLGVTWDPKNERYTSKTVFASKSVCDQRRGRTGRTCSGRVFRLVTRRFYINKMNDWENPQIQVSSCRDELLSLVSSTASRQFFSDPQLILERCMDPPPAISLEKASNYLLKIGACEEDRSASRRSSRRSTKLSATKFGKLLSSLPFGISKSAMLVRGAKEGLLRETLVLVSILTCKPSPIRHTFGESNEDIVKKFYPAVDCKSPISVAIADLSAYAFWDVHWNNGVRNKESYLRFVRCTRSFSNVQFQDYVRKNHPRAILDIPESLMHCDDPPIVGHYNNQDHDCGVRTWTKKKQEVHIKWCKYYNINPTSVTSIAANVQAAMDNFFREEPEWLRCQPPNAKWLSFTRNNESTSLDMMQQVYGDEASEICKKLMDLLNESKKPTTNSGGRPIACVHFLQGHCIYGDQCRNSHSPNALPPPCRFFFQYGGCTKQNCPYSHDAAPLEEETLIEPGERINVLDELSYGGGPAAWFRAPRPVASVGENYTNFAMSLMRIGIPVRLDLSLGITDAIRLHVIHTGFDRIATQHLRFASISPCNDHWTDEENKSYINALFLSVVCFFNEHCKVSATTLPSFGSTGCELGLVMTKAQFAKHSVLQLAENVGLFLRWWNSWCVEDFPLPGSHHFDDHAIFYLFSLK